MVHRCKCRGSFLRWVKYILIIFLWLFGNTAIAERLSYSFKKKSLSGVLEKISSDNHVKIAFDAQLADKQVVNGIYQGATVDELLTSILSSSNFDMDRIGSVYVVKPKRGVSAAEQAPVAVKPTFELPRFKVWGTIVDQETGEKLPYAYIYTQDKKYAVSANAEGYFNLILPDSKPVTLCISYLGFEKKCVEVIPETKSGMLSINLDRAHAVLSSVVVTQKQNYLVQIPSIAGKSTLNPRAASDVPSINSLDFTPSLQMLPGIDATVESAAGLSIRKSPSSQTQVLFDGFTLYHVNHFLGQLSAFNTKAIKDIQIFKGGFDARYGGAASSVIEITGKSGNRYKPTFSVGVDPLSADAFADIPVSKKLSIVVAARRSYTDVCQTSLYTDLFDKLRSDIAEESSSVGISSYNEKYSPKYHFLDLHSKLTYNPDSTQSLSLSVYGGGDNMDLLSDRKRLYLSENSDIDNQGIGFTWSKQVTNKYFLRTSVGYSSYLLNFTHLDISRNVKLEEIARRYSALHNQLKDFTAKIEYEYRFLPSAGVIAGSVFSNQNSIYSFKNYRSNQANVINDISKREVSDGSSAVGYLLLNAGKGWLKNFTPGLRFTYFTPTKKVYVEPRVQLSVEATKGITLKMAAGRYLQFMNSIPVPFIGDYTSYWMVANGEKSPVVSSNHFIGGITYDATSSLQFDVESYFKRTTGLMSQVMVPFLENGKYRLRQINFYTSNDIVGVDVLAKYLYAKGQIALAYSISEATVFSNNLKVDDKYPADNDQLHEFKAFASHRLGRFNLSAAWIFGSGKPWDELVLYNNLKVVPDYEKNSHRLGPYHRLDLSASYEQKIGPTLLCITASIFNVYDNDNEIMRSYSFSNTPFQDASQGKSPLIYNDIYGLRFTPSLYVNLTF